MTCKHTKASCYDSRKRKDGHRWRRYECLDCGDRWSSIEVAVDQVKRGNGHTAMDQLRKKVLTEGEGLLGGISCVLDALDRGKVSGTPTGSLAKYMVSCLEVYEETTADLYSWRKK